MPTEPHINYCDLEPVRAAQLEWFATPLRVRLRVIARLRQLIAEHAEELADATRVTQAHPRAEKLVGEVLPLADACRFLERDAERILSTRCMRTAGRPFWLAGVTCEVRRVPWGVVLIIGPANFPLMLAGVQAVQALAAGNAVVWKPGHGGTPAATLFARLAEHAGLDRRLLLVIDESTAAAKAAIAAGPDKVVLTGSATTGSAVLAELAGRLIPATMELSGCDAMIVLPEANLDLVARAVANGLRFNGSETCIAPRRILVPADLSEKMGQMLAEYVDRLPLRAVRPAAAELASRLVQQAISVGAKRLTGGPACSHVAQSGVLPATVLFLPIGMDPSRVELLNADVFAPVVTLVPTANVDEAVCLANRCQYALGASVFGPESLARAVAHRLRAGSICVNDVIVATADPRLPFGGRGRSGFGLTRGPEGLLEMTTAQCVSIRRGRYEHLDEPRPDDAEFFATYIRTAHSGSIWSRMAHGWRLVRMATARMWG